MYCFYAWYFFISTRPFSIMEGALFVQKLKTVKQLEMLPVLRMSVQGPLFQDDSNKMQQLKGTLTLETNFMHIYFLKHIFFSSNILSITLYVTARKMRDLNKSNVLATTESINRTLKKNAEKTILNIWVQYVPSSVTVGNIFAS